LKIHGVAVPTSANQNKVNFMSRFTTRMFVSSLLIIGITGLVRADSVTTQPAQTVASVDQLKAEAFKAIKIGDFDRSTDLLEQAATLSPDPQTQRMAQWTQSFEDQRKTFAGERHTQFEKAVADVQLLLKNKMDSYAIDEAAHAYLLADNKDDFLKQKWMVDLIAETVDSAAKDDASEQWLKAVRLYSDLCSLQPADSDWRDKFDASMRRVTLLMLYAPDRLKQLQEVESKERQAADDVLFPTTRPTVASATTEPTTLPDVADAAGDDNSKMDWREVTRGVQYDMLWDSLVYAEQEYFRDVTFQDLLEGGLTGLNTLVTTKGLEEAFPGLADADKRQKFIDGINECMADAKASTDYNAEEVLTQSLNKLRDLNDKTVQLPEEVFVCQFADGAFSDLDPFSKVIWPSEVEDTERMTQGEFGGVGLEIQSDDLGNLKVVTPLEDTPAYRSGIEAGDIITQIDGKSAKGLLVDRAVKLIMGTPGSTVTLTIRALDKSVKDHTLRREEIKVASVEGYKRKPGGGWEYIVDPEQKIAYVRLISFSKTTSDDLGTALDDAKAEGAKALILDLRDNLGGLLPAATGVVNKFVSDGVIVDTRPDRLTGNMPVRINARPEDVQTDMPLVVLVNQWSASASEIVSGALQDHHRAMLIGERTYGKGSVQMLYPLDSGKGYLKLTTAHYYLPNGRCIHREKNSKTWGVDPDVTIEMTPQQMQVVIDTRRDMDVLRGPNEKPDATPTTQPVKDLLEADSQLSAGVLMLRLELAGAQL
jgi:carboxyl-terminal processing protease